MHSPRSSMVPFVTSIDLSLGNKGRMDYHGPANTEDFMLLTCPRLDARRNACEKQQFKLFLRIQKTKQNKK